MEIGTVKWFNSTKGFGFIKPDNSTSDIFVHISAVREAGLSTLNEGQRIKFNILNENGKTSAINLQSE